MHLLLTDILTCPRCGPTFGLVVLADRIADRDVVEGRLGCPNCRTEYPVSGGVADLRTDLAQHGRSTASEADPETPLRLAALLGVGQQQGQVAVSGGGPRLVAEVADLLPNAGVFGHGRVLPDAVPERRGWILHSDRLPFRDGSLRGVAVLGEPSEWPLAEIARVLFPGARLVVDGTGPGFVARLADEGFEMLLEQEGVAVASRNRPR